ncbi:hypothetical protein MCANUFG4_02081 [Mycoplasmopsis canis UFG4]|uniref:Uncharacterized protein n=2 Tax=Mycoplasmopsis canis TaxID=29555 RepID=I1A5R2_9BACT|nr:hypothetical protein [Mycoplasmopsis canis]AKF40985.1 hypothetical protein AAW50_00830 [Mycoplasmopsis canis]AMD81097.1 hypothetical protein AXW82_00785 [Mycoplasmopsis canis PG 14]EIE39835.1 hypothetical protein MCANPG14_02136 [Mycoplasmopsis canis PG 14]EIE40051.1 hypothetical protein MCANUF31_02101 [Mycoplasmopsis canis UF31]EIE40267.1 hypothetical protein MCANUF33_02126 [Mycoplasmopsis canis UF33]
MKTVADIEKLKLLAEEYLRLSKEAKEVKKMMKEIVQDTEIEINEPLSEGGRVIYTKPEAKTVIDRKLVTELLFNIVLDYNSETSDKKIPSNQEIEEKIRNYCQVLKEYKWKLTIKQK